METETKTNFYSTNKLIDFLKEKLSCKDFTQCVCYFEGDDVFHNNFDGLCMKPLFIQLTGTTNKYLNYNQIKELFGNEIIVSFKENKKRTLSKKNGVMYVLCIDFIQMNYKDNYYYPSYLTESTNKKNNEKIRKQVQIEFKQDDLDDDAFI